MSGGATANPRSGRRSRRRAEKGHRRQGREIALQMLYQWESAESHPSEVLRAFDLALYRTETAAGSGAVEEPVGSREEAPATPEATQDAEPAEVEEDDIDRRRRQAMEADLERQITASLGEKARSREFLFARELFLGVVAEHEELDGLIARRAENWRVERMPRVDKNILRLALHELRRDPDLPRPVILDEAIELAKKFGGEQSGAFVNGVLDGVLRNGEVDGASPGD